MKPTPSPLKKLFLLLSMILIFNVVYTQDIYWVGGAGSWDDISHWSKVPGNEPPAPAGIIPTANHDVFIDKHSGLTLTSTIAIPPGDYAVKNLTVTALENFLLAFNGNGSGASSVTMTVFGDLELISSMNLGYLTTDIQDNVWKFDGPNSHDIETGNRDLLNVEFLDENGIFNQLSNLRATEQIRMYAGTWNSNGLNVNSGRLLFQDTAPSNAPLTKVFNTGSSDILCDEWESGFTYGSLTVTGTHTIYTKKFRGSPMQTNGPAFHFNDIHLLEYSDAPIGGVVIEHNNFECRDCIIENIVVEDTGDTKLADKFTVNGKFTVVNTGSKILFNGGNGRDSEAIFNGLVITPSVSGCGTPRTIFSSIHTDLTTFTRASGSLTINDAIINNVEATGGAIFNAANSALQGASTGWNITNPPNPLNYVWIGIGGALGNWTNPNLWVLQSTGTSNGCIPTLVDNVFIDGNAKGGIRIPSPYTAECNDFIWTNKDGRELELAGTNNLESALLVTGNFQIEQNATVSGVNRHEIYFNSATGTFIETQGVVLPEIWFIGDLGNWQLNDDLVCDRFTFEGGTFNTKNNDVTTDYWNCIDSNPKHFIFGSSTITVNGEMALSRAPTANVTVTPGTSLIICEDLTSTVGILHDVKLINTSGRLLENYAYDFNKLILGGTGEVSTQNDLTLNDLIFEANGSALAVDINDDFTINGGIESTTTVANPGILKSRTLGVRADVDKAVGNICAIGPIAFQDINATLSGVFNAPEGIDNGNNNGINYDDGGLSLTMYWIGGSGEFQVKNNWSKVSGGCPANESPFIYPTLVFNNFGLYNSTETVLVPNSQTCGELYFYNSAKDIDLSVTFSLNPSKLVIANGDLSMDGNYVTVNGETSVESGGVLSTDMLNFRTKELNCSSGLVIVRNGSTLTVEN